MKFLFVAAILLHIVRCGDEIIDGVGDEKEAKSPWDIVTPTGNSFKMYYDTVSNLVKMEAEVRNDTYFGIGFGRTMRNCDMITFKGTGIKGEVID